MAAKADISVSIALAAFLRSAGFSIDYGGSLIKLVYTPKNQPLPSEGQVDLQVITFPGTDLRAALDFIKDNVRINRSNQWEAPTVTCTGAGVNREKEQIEQELNIRIQIVWESAPIIGAFRYLGCQIPWADFLYPREQEAIDNKRTDASEIAEFLVHLDRGIVPGGDVATRPQSETTTGPQSETTTGPQSETTTGLQSETTTGLQSETTTGLQSETPIRPQSETTHEQVSSPGGKDQPVDPLAEQRNRSFDFKECFPCILTQFGSGVASLQVQPDGQFRSVSYCQRGGTSIMGLGACVTGAKTFKELADLFCRGDISSVDQLASNIQVSSENGPNLLGDVKADPIIFSFGHASGKSLGDFKREDLARSVLYNILLEVIEDIVLVAHALGVKHVFVLGTIVSNVLARQILESEFEYRIIQSPYLLQMASDIHIHIVKDGAYFGALGGLLKDAGIEAEF